MLDGKHPSLNSSVHTFAVKDYELAESDVLTLYGHANPLGISPGYLASGKLVSLAISDGKNCRIVEFEDPEAKSFGRRPKGNGKPSQPSVAQVKGRKLLQEHVLCRNAGDIFAFDMAPLAMALHSVGLRITRAVDIQSAFPEVDRKPLSIIKDAFKEASEGVKKINEDNVRQIFLRAVYDLEDNARNRLTDLAMRAWVSQFLVVFENGEQTFEKVKRIDTKMLPEQVRFEFLPEFA